jgi:hypothetical protein
MENEFKLYHAIVWTSPSNSMGKRVDVLAKTLAEAKAELEKKYGVGNIYDLHNKEDAAKPR